MRRALDAVPGWLAVPLLLGCMTWLMVSAMATQGATFDERAYIGAGYSYLTTGDYRINPEHPPLGKILAALPLLALRPPMSTTWKEWQEVDALPFGGHFLYGTTGDATRLIFRARLACTGLAVLLGLFLWGWTRELAGRPAAHLALLLYALTPDFLAHGGLVSLDLAAAAFSLGSAWLWWRVLRRFTALDLAAASLLLGCAVASKLSALFLVPAFAGAALHHTLKRAAGPARLRRLAVVAASLSAGVLAVLWASYGFHSAPPLSDQGLPIHHWHAFGDDFAARCVAFIRDTRLLPEAFTYGLLIITHAARQHFAFLNGRHSLHGWWYYYLECLALKVPLPLLVGAAAAPFLARWKIPAMVWCPPLVFLGIVSGLHSAIGHRYLLPMLPFLVVVAALALDRLMVARWPAQVLGGVLVAWLAWGTLSVRPAYLAYFNELAGGPARGWQYLSDSNLDWGQGLPALREWMAAHHVARVALSYFGTDVPEYYGIDYQALPSYQVLRRPCVPWSSLRPGDRVAISLTNLEAVYFQRDTPVDRQFRAVAAWLRQAQVPEAVVDRCMFIYRWPGKG